MHNVCVWLRYDNTSKYIITNKIKNNWCRFNVINQIFENILTKKKREKKFIICKSFIVN